MCTNYLSYVHSIHLFYGVISGQHTLVQNTFLKHKYKGNETDFKHKGK